MNLREYISAQSILPSRSLKISNSLVSAQNVTYSVGFSSVNPLENIGSLKISFCNNSPIIDTPCDQIDGMDIQSAILSGQTGPGDFVISSINGSSTIIFNRPVNPIGNNSVSLTLNGITNPSKKGTYYGRIQTYASQDASGPMLSSGGVTFSITEPLVLNTEVPPFLYLCVAIDTPNFECRGNINSFVDMGELSSNNTNTGTSQFIVATNAGSGFNVSIRGSPPTSGNNIILAMDTVQQSLIGSSQFGINLRDNNIPDVGSDPVGAGSGVVASDYNNANFFKFNSGDTIVYANSPSLDRKYTVSYIINVPRDQSPGIYSGTYLYTAIASF